MNAEWPIRHSQGGNTRHGERPSVKVIDTNDDLDLLRQRHFAENRINALLHVHFRWRSLCDDSLRNRKKNNSHRQTAVVSSHLVVSSAPTLWQRAGATRPPMVRVPYVPCNFSPSNRKFAR